MTVKVWKRSLVYPSGSQTNCVLRLKVLMVKHLDFLPPRALSDQVLSRWDGPSSIEGKWYHSLCS